MKNSNAESNRFQGLSAAEKRTLLVRLLREKACMDASAPPPLSHGQRSLWYLQQSDPNSPAYNEAFTCRIRSPIDLEPLLPALARTVLDRHAVLWTIYPIQLGEPRQQVQAPQPLSIPVVEAHDWTPAQLRERFQEEGGRPFDLQRGPMIRLALFRRPRQEYILLITFHHIAIDLWSLMLLLDELGTQGQGLVPKRAPASPSTAVQYVDFCHWQTRMLDGPEGQTHWDYWRKQLAGELPSLDLPTSQPRPAFPSFRSAQRTFQLSELLSNRLKQLAREEHVTLFTVLLGAFQVLLGRYCGQSDVLIGSMVSGRTRPEFERVVGFFANMVPLRADLSADPPFRAFLGQTWKTILEAMAHQDFPFSLLVERLLPDRDPNRPPLCNITFLLQKPRQLDAPKDRSSAAPQFDLLAPEERLARLSSPYGWSNIAPVDLGIAKSDLDLEMFETALVLGGALTYRTDLFDAATIDRLLDHFHILLEGIVANPECRLSSLPLLSPAERQQLLGEWNSAGEPSATELRRDCCLHHLFEEQAKRTPDVVAVAAGGQEWTYHQINHRADVLARRLRRAGVGTEMFVAVCVERSPEMLAALLAVLKAGGAFVPLDPAYPAERLAFQLQDANVGIILTQSSLARIFSSYPGQVICLGEETFPDEEHGSQAGDTVEAANLAYLIYTSGSSGTPKGVAVEHRAIVRHSRDVIAAYALGPGDRVLLFASICFDLSLQQIFPALACGAAVVLRDDAMLASAATFLDRCREWGITALMLPTSYWHELTAQLDAEGLTLPPALRVVEFGGETASADCLARWRARVPASVRLVNAYGPTEATVAATACDLTKLAGEVRIVPIGRPLPGKEVYVLDGQRHLVPLGVAGELYLGGPCLARGYWNRPELTAEKFVEHPFRPGLGARLYRTGDRVRWRADGNLEFLGRLDQQVKIRGILVEPAEVETRLSEHSRVAENVVLAREDVPGNRFLAAYVVATPGADVMAAELRDFLRQRLPGAMIPSVFVLLDALPRSSSNGKVDRRALPVPKMAEERPDANVPPRTPLEETLVSIWSKVLGSQRVGIYDNFFDCGGHSLQILQLIARINASLNRQISVREVFLAPTVAAMARLLEKSAAEERTADEEDRGPSPFAPPSADPIPANESVDLAAEAILDPTIRPSGPGNAFSGEPAHVLLTGATGFLGAYLLEDLLRQNRGQVHCLVRCAGAEAGVARLRTQLGVYGLWNESFAARLVVVPGDLAAPRLGLSAETFNELAHTIDVIYHNGALVNMVYPYPQLKAANVRGTEEVLRLACARRVKPLHYVSTLSVFPPTEPGRGPLREEEAPERWTDLRVGYAQSKWVAEKLVTQAAARGLPVAVYRPGRITGHSQTGLCPPNDLLVGMLRDLIRLGAAPDFDMLLEMTPVDYVSRAIVHLSRQPASLGRIFHLTNPHSVPTSRLLGVLRRRGYDLHVLPLADWLGGANGNARIGDLSMLPWLTGSVSPEYLRAALQSQDFDCTNALASLADSDVRCPPVDERLLEIYLDYLVREGLMEPPTGETGGAHTAAGRQIEPFATL
ncbi:MAG: non-ribosomal peptide synthetase [Gemmataceae bacterium]